MNEAREFILSLEKQYFKLAFSFKATKDKIRTDSIYVIFKPNYFDFLYLLDKFTSNQEFKNDIIQFYQADKFITFCFCSNKRKVFIEEKVFESQMITSFTKVSKNPADFKNILSPELYDYLDFSNCLSKNNIYIKFRKSKISNLIIKGLMKTLLNLQSDLDEVSKHRNLTILMEWLNRRKEIKWLQITENNMSIYVI